MAKRHPVYCFFPPILFLATILLPLLSSSEVMAAAYYVSPGENLNTAINRLLPGDTLTLRDGRYYSSMEINVSGTASQPITIRAENDGMAIVDGQMSRIPFQAGRGTHHLIIEGIRFQNSSGSTVAIYGSYITLRRVSAYNSGEGNVHIFEIGYTNDVLLEDCASSGKGRNNYLIFESDRVTLRRCWGLWMARNGTGDANNFSQFYGTDDCRIEYSVGTFDQGASVRNVNPISYWIADWNGTDSDNRNILESCVFYGYEYHNIWMGNQGKEQRDNVMRNNVIIANNGYTEVFQRGGGNFLIEGNTFVNNGLNWQTIRTESQSTVIRNNSFVGGTALGLGGSVVRSGNNYDVSSVGAPLVNGETTLSPNYDVGRYGKGAYLMRPSGFSKGAQILFDNEGRRLWPWPMEDRIQKEMRELFGKEVSVTCEEKGGVWKTLDGVYSSGEPTPTTRPSPTPTKTPTATPTGRSTATPHPASRKTG